MSLPAVPVAHIQLHVFTKEEATINHNKHCDKFEHSVISHLWTHPGFCLHSASTTKVSECSMEKFTISLHLA